MVGFQLMIDSSPKFDVFDLEIEGLWKALDLEYQVPELVLLTLIDSPRRSFFNCRMRIRIVKSSPNSELLKQGWEIL